MHFNALKHLDEITRIVEPEIIINKNDIFVNNLKSISFDKYFSQYFLDIYSMYVNSFFKQYFGLVFIRYPFLKFIYYLQLKNSFYFFECLYQRRLNLQVTNFYNCYCHKFFSRFELLLLDVDFYEFNYNFFSGLFPNMLIILPEFFLVWCDIISYHALRISLIHLRFSLYNEYLSINLPLYPRIRRLLIMRLDKFWYATSSNELWLYLYYLYYRYFVVYDCETDSTHNSFASSFIYDPAFVFFFKSNFLKFFEKFKGVFLNFSKKFEEIFLFLFYFWANFFCLKNRGFTDLLKFPLRRFFEFFYLLPTSLTKYFFLIWFYDLYKQFSMFLYDEVNYFNANLNSSFYSVIRKKFWNFFFLEYTSLKLFFYIPFLVDFSTKIKDTFNCVAFRLISENPFTLEMLKNWCLISLTDEHNTDLYKSKNKKIYLLYNITKKVDNKGTVSIYCKKCLTDGIILLDYYAELTCYYYVTYSGVHVLNSFGDSVFFEDHSKNNFNINLNDYYVWYTPWGAIWLLSTCEDTHIFSKYIKLLFDSKAETIRGFSSLSNSFLNNIKLSTSFWYDYNLLIDWVYYEFFVEIESLETLFMKIFNNYFFLSSKLNVFPYFFLPITDLFQTISWFVCSYLDIKVIFDYVFDTGFVFFLNRILLDSFQINYIYSLFIFSRFSKPSLSLKLKSRKNKYEKNSNFNYLLSFFTVKDIFFQYFLGNFVFDIFLLLLFLKKTYFFKFFLKILYVKGSYNYHFPLMSFRYVSSVPKIDSYYPYANKPQSEMPLSFF